MELTAEHGRAVPAYMGRGAAEGRRMVGGLLAEGRAGKAPADADHALAAANFLAYTMFTVQIAQGLHPKQAADFIGGEDRGDELARGFIEAGTVEVCCDYCGQLLGTAMAAAAAGQMRAVHGERAGEQWEALSFALTGPPF